MECSKCRELKQAFELKLTQYIEARASVFYRVSTELAASKNVDMERSRNDLYEHQLVCASGVQSHAQPGPHLADSAVAGKEAAGRSHLSSIDQICRLELF